MTFLALTPSNKEDIMRAVIQRVSAASVVSDGILTGKIGQGLVLLLGVAKGDEKIDAELLAAKIAKLRIFSDENGKMNLSVNDVDGEVMIVSNFTLGANYAHGNRPDYLASAKPPLANGLYDCFIFLMSQRVRRVATGRFGADMQTEMTTDGPVTIVMHSHVLRGGKK